MRKQIDNGGRVHPGYGQSSGISLRDYFAIRILCASIQDDYDIHTESGRRYYSKNAYRMADRMIEQSKEAVDGR